MADIGMADWDMQLTESVAEKIRQDFFDMQIFVEADLQSSICMELRGFIKKNENEKWRVFNQVHQLTGKGKSIYPDILLTRNMSRMLAIELKQSAGRQESVPFSSVLSDVVKMGKYGTNHKIPTYVYYTCYKNKGLEKDEYEQLLTKSNSYGKWAPTIVLINLSSTLGHADWYKRLRAYRSEWKQFYNDKEMD